MCCSIPSVHIDFFSRPPPGTTYTRVWLNDCKCYPFPRHGGFKMSSLLLDLLAFLKSRKIRLETVAITAMISNGRKFKPALPKDIRSRQCWISAELRQTGLKTSFSPPKCLLGYGLRLGWVMEFWKTVKFRNIDLKNNVQTIPPSKYLTDFWSSFKEEVTSSLYTEFLAT